MKSWAILIVVLLAGGSGACTKNVSAKPNGPEPKPQPKEASMLGLRTAMYAAPDIAAAKAWYTEVLKVEPYFDEPFYVGFNVGGFELGLNPDAKTCDAGVVAYWGVENADAEIARLITLGAKPHTPVRDVGGGIRIGSVFDPFGNLFGVIYNPHFKIPEAARD